MLRVYRYDSSNAQLTGGSPGGSDGAAPSAGIPIRGFKKIKAFMRTPAGPATLTIQQYLKANSTPVATAILTTGGSFPAEADNKDGTAVVGELAAITLVNGATAQTPEVLVQLMERADEL